MVQDPHPIAPPEVDTSTPSIARTYDAFLGGKDNFAVDRGVLHWLKETMPEVAHTAVVNRQWLLRAVRFLTHAGIDQFLDVGSGLPSAENTHQVAQWINPEAVVVYVDNDPACCAFGRALLNENEYTHFVDADLTQPGEVLHHPDVIRHLDFTRPVGLIQCATMHHVADERRPREIMDFYRQSLPSGSYLALTHFCDPEDTSGYYTALAHDLVRRAHEYGFDSGQVRTRTEIEAYFGDWDLIEPGAVFVPDWWPDGPRTGPASDAEQLMLGGVARKP